MQVNNTTEEWRHVDCLPPNVEVSSMGRLRKYLNMKTTELIPQTMTNGAYAIWFQGKTYQVHRLVAEAFVPNPDPERLVMVKHKSEDKTDNRPENLEWISRVTNITRNPKWRTDTRDRVLCVETDTVYATMRSAAVATGIPQELIAEGIKQMKPVFGYSFIKIESDNLRIAGRNIHYIDYNTLCEIAFKAVSLQQGNDMIRAAIGDGWPVE